MWIDNVYLVRILSELFFHEMLPNFGSFPEEVYVEEGAETRDEVSNKRDE